MSGTVGDPPGGSLTKLLLESVVDPELDRLEVGDPIATGGVGEVLAVRDRVLGRQCAMKVLKESFVSEPLVLRGFLREAQVTAQLNHPNIVPVHELRVEHGVPCFTMSRVVGQSLAEWMRDNVLVDHETATAFVELLLKVCDALAFAHSRGVIHCDLKPSNVMVGSFGEVYLMDWGGAELLDDAAFGGAERVSESLPPIPEAMTEGKIFGTPAYMAPERARGQRGDARSDIFSMGAMMYEFIVGKPPFTHPQLRDAIRAAQRCAYEPIDDAAHNNVFPVELFRIVRQAMAADPDSRHPTVADLKADLTRVARGGGSFPVRELAVGEHIIRENEAGDAAYIVSSGRLEVYRRVDGRKVHLRELTSGDLFGEMAIFARSPRTASVVAIEPTVVAEITADVMRRELDTMKPWMSAFVRTLARRFHESETRRLEQTEDAADAEPSWWRRG